jgi:DNA-binding beta-propeller fold protein YncE
MKSFIYFKRISLTVLFAFMLSSPVFADQLTFVEFQQDGVDGVDGLGVAAGVDISPDGKHVYVTGAGDDAVAVFSRNTATGALTFVSFSRMV